MTGGPMVIRNSLQLLEQISEVEERIKILEERIKALGVEVDRDKLIEALLTRRI